MYTWPFHLGRSICGTNLRMKVLPILPQKFIEILTPVLHAGDTEHSLFPSGSLSRLGECDNINKHICWMCDT